MLLCSLAPHLSTPPPPPPSLPTTTGTPPPPHSCSVSFAGLPGLQASPPYAAPSPSWQLNTGTTSSASCIQALTFTLNTLTDAHIGTYSRAHKSAPAHALSEGNNYAQLPTVIRLIGLIGPENSAVNFDLVHWHFLLLSLPSLSPPRLSAFMRATRRCVTCARTQPHFNFSPGARDGGLAVHEVIEQDLDT
jgi:hypothetical protein